MNTKLYAVPTTVESRTLTIHPEDVDLFRLTEFTRVYYSHVEKHGVDRFGQAPEFMYTVRPTLTIKVLGYTI